MTAGSNPYIRSEEVDANPNLDLRSDADPLATFAVGAIYTSASGWTYGSSFTDITANIANRQLVRFGVFVRNTNGNDVEAVLATLRVEIQGCD